MMDVLMTKPPETSEVVDEISLIKQQTNQSAQEAEGGQGGRKRTVSKSKSTTSNNSSKLAVVQWPEFKVPLPDPELGFTGEIFCGKGSLTPEQTLIEFISTSASFHDVKKQPLRSLEWDLLKVFQFNVMPANAAAWYMAKRKFYMNQSFDQQLLPYLLKKYPEKFRVIGNSVVFLEVYKKDVAKAKLRYLVQYGLNAYFSHKADEYGVYFFDPFYYENTEPFHESLKQCSPKANSNVVAAKNKLVSQYFSSQGIKEQFKFRQHSNYLVSISKQPGVKIVTNKTGVIISMINNQYGFIKFGDSGETALFCCKSLFKDGWLFSGDPLRLPAMKFDGYKIPGGGMQGDQAYSWYAVLVWCGRRPSPKFCSTAEDLNSTPVFREGLQRMSVGGDGKRLRQPSSSMMVGQVMEIRRNGAVLKVREDSVDKVFVPGWQRQMANSEGKWLSTLSGECIGLGDLVAYYVDTHESRPGYAAVGKNVMVLKESEERIKGKEKRRRRRRQSTERSAGARYEVGETTDDEKPTSSRRRRSKKKVGDSTRGETTATEDTETEEDVTDGELEWLERDLQTIIDKEHPQTKTLKLLRDVHTKLNLTRGTQRKMLRKTGIKTLRGGYTPMKTTSDDFWRMRRMLAKVETNYNEESDVDYVPGADIEEITRPRTGSETQGDTSFTSAGASRSGRSRRSSVGSVSTAAAANAGTAGVAKRSLPYWVTAMNKPEKYDPELEKFVSADKYYKEENDPDYVLPATDDEVSEEENEEEDEDVSVLESDAKDKIPEDLQEGKHKETPKKVVSPVKVTLTPSKEGEQEEEEETRILTLESEPEPDQAGDSDSKETRERRPKLWETSLLLEEQPDDYDSDDDPEYVPSAVIVDTDLEYDEYLEGEDVISDNEVEQLKEDAKKETGSVTPKCYIAVWVPVESPAERIERAKDQLAKVIPKPVIQDTGDTSSKDTDSNGKKEDVPTNKNLNGLGVETGLTPVMRKLSVGSKPEAEGNEDGSPKAKRERRKSKSKSESKNEEKPSEEETREEAAAPKTPTKGQGGDSKSPKISPEKQPSKIPVKVPVEQEESSVKKPDEAAAAL